MEWGEVVSRVRRGVEGSGNDEAIDFWELYDLKKDVMEVNNVYDNPKYVKVREALTVQLEKLRKDVGVTE